MVGEPDHIHDRFVANSPITIRSVCPHTSYKAVHTADILFFLGTRTIPIGPELNRWHTSPYVYKMLQLSSQNQLRTINSVIGRFQG